LNQPKFCSDAKWVQNGITFADESMVGKENLAIFIDKFNNIYTIDQTNKNIKIWKENSLNHIKTISVTIKESWSIFVTINGFNNKIEKLTNNSMISQTVMNVNGPCTGLFIDQINRIYYSIDKQHFILRKSLDDNSTAIKIAGNDLQGSTANLLNNPREIFVDQDFN
jgi:hypothetical protein